MKRNQLADGLLWLHRKRLTALAAVVCLLLSLTPVHASAVIDEEQDTLRYFRYIAVGTDGYIAGSAVVVNIPGRGIYAYTQGSDVFGENPEGNLIDAAGDELYDMEFVERVGEWYTWKVFGLDGKAEDLLAAEAPEPDDVYLAIYILYGEDDEILTAYDLMKGMTLENDFGDGSALFRMPDTITEVNENDALQAGFMFRIDGACIGILLRDNIFYCDWFDAELFGVSTGSSESAEGDGNERPEELYDIELHFGIYDRENDRVVRWVEEDQLTTDNLEENQILSPVLRVTNRTDSTLRPEVSAVIDGEERTWSVTDLEAGDFQNNWCTSDDAVAFGTHSYRYYVDGIECLSGTYEIRHGTAPDPTPSAENKYRVVEFGHFEQDNNLGNGTEPIEWLVLNEDSGYYLLLSKKAIDAQTFDYSTAYITWDRSSVRRYLNGGFMDLAFTNAERGAISEALVKNGSAQLPEGVTSVVSDTFDKVFLLSDAEVRAYFDNREERSCESTAYVRAKEQESKISADGWWLRTAYDPKQAAFGFVTADGRIRGEKNGTVCGIRPALWVRKSMIDD